MLEKLMVDLYESGIDCEATVINCELEFRFIDTTNNCTFISKGVDEEEVIMNTIKNLLIEKRGK